MVNVSHDTDDRGPLDHILFVLVVFLQEFFDHVDLFLLLTEDIIIHGDGLGFLIRDFAVDGHDLARQEELLNDLRGLQVHFFRQLTDGELLRDLDGLDLLFDLVFRLLFRPDEPAGPVLLLLVLLGVDQVLFGAPVAVLVHLTFVIITLLAVSAGKTAVRGTSAAGPAASGRLAGTGILSERGASAGCLAALGTESLSGSGASAVPAVPVTVEAGLSALAALTVIPETALAAALTVIPVAALAAALTVISVAALAAALTVIPVAALAAALTVISVAALAAALTVVSIAAALTVIPVAALAFCSGTFTGPFRLPGRFLGRCCLFRCGSRSLCRRRGLLSRGRSLFCRGRGLFRRGSRRRGRCLRSCHGRCCFRRRGRGYGRFGSGRCYRLFDRFCLGGRLGRHGFFMEIHFHLTGNDSGPDRTVYILGFQPAAAVPAAVSGAAGSLGAAIAVIPACAAAGTAFPGLAAAAGIRAAAAGIGSSLTALLAASGISGHDNDLFLFGRRFSLSCRT